MRLYSCRGVRMGMVPDFCPSRAMLYRTIQCFEILALRCDAFSVWQGMTRKL